jgi:hypothetical protein
LESPQRPQFIAEDVMCAGRALLDPTDVQGGRPEVDLIPAQVNQFGRPQAVPIGHQDHGGVAPAMAVVLGGGDQPLDLGLGEVFAGAQVGVRPSARWNCSFYDGWRDQLEMRFRHGFQSRALATVRKMALLRTMFNYASSPMTARPIIPASATRAPRG